MAVTDNESWVVETGAAVVEKKAANGLDCLTFWERLVYCLWVVDYGMRNAGDLRTATDVYADFQSDARCAAEELSLPLTREVFSLSPSKLEEVYFDHFEAICDEIKAAGRQR